jgi:hypothetical protein
LLPHSGRLLHEFTSAEGIPAFPTLLECFEAVMVQSIPESYVGRTHPDDPVIDLTSVTRYRADEILVAVQKALQSKDRGSSYSTDILVLHTSDAANKPYFPGTGMHSGTIVEAAKLSLPLLKERFNQVWFLKAYWTAQKRLHRVK